MFLRESIAANSLGGKFLFRPVQYTSTRRPCPCAALPRILLRTWRSLLSCATAQEASPEKPKGVADMRVLACAPLMLFARCSLPAESGEKKNGKKDDNIKVVVDYLDKTWGIKYKSHTAEDSTFMG